MPVLKKWKSLGFFCCSVWLSLLPAEEELSQVMPLPKWFTWVHRPTVPHVIHTVIDLFLYKNLWLSQYKLLLRCTYFCCNVDITALKKKKNKIYFYSLWYYFFHGFFSPQSSDISEVWNGDEKKLSSHSCSCCKSELFMIDPNIKEQILPYMVLLCSYKRQIELNWICLALSSHCREHVALIFSLFLTRSR